MVRFEVGGAGDERRVWSEGLIIKHPGRKALQGVWGGYRGSCWVMGDMQGLQRL